MSLTNDDVRELLRLLDSADADELELETSRFRLSLRRAGDGEWVQESEVRSEPTVIARGDADEPAGEPAPTASAPGHRQPPAAATPPAERVGLVEVTAPLLGTFYRSPKPGAPPFVEVGSRVEESSVIGLVETMKLFTSVAAGVAGTIAEICAADAQFVEQGTVLARVDPER